MLVTAEKVVAETATLNPAEDTYISEHFPGPNGLALDIVIGVQGVNAGNAVNRGLIKFNLSSIPANATINSATLRLVVSRSAPGPSASFALHRLLVPWDELDATWTTRIDPDENWSVPGGAAGTDFSDASSSTRIIASSGAYTFGSTPEMVADIVHWVNQPAENHGWIIKAGDENVGFTGKRVGSGGSGLNAPQLTIDYTNSVVIPMQPRVVAVRHNRSLVRLQFLAEASFTYTVEFRNSVEEGEWAELTNVTAKLADFDAFAFDSLEASPQRFYRLSRVPCNCD